MLTQSTLTGFSIKVYSLSDYEGNVFYVGCTGRDLKARLYAHLHGGTKDHKQQEKYQKILSLNRKVQINLLEEIGVVANNISNAVNKCSEFEAKWALYYLRTGIELTNREVGLKRIGIFKTIYKGKVCWIELNKM